MPERARRRTYTAKYKRDVLAEYEACDRASKGALLRRKACKLVDQRVARTARQGRPGALGKSAGPAPAVPAVREVARLRKENERLAVELDKACRVIDVQGNSRLCWTPSRSTAAGTTARVIDAAITELEPLVGVKDSCPAVCHPRATLYRWHRKSPAPSPRPPGEPRPTSSSCGRCS